MKIITILLCILFAGVAFGQTQSVKFHDATLVISAQDTVVYPIGTFGYINYSHPAISSLAELYWKAVIASYWNTNYSIRVYNSWGDFVWEDVGRTTLTNMNHPEEILAELQDDVNGKVQISTNGGFTWKYLYYMGVDKDKQIWAVLPVSNYGMGTPVLTPQNVINPPRGLYPDMIAPMPGEVVK